MRPLQPVSEYVNGILSGDRVWLARAITLVESTRPEHAAVAQAIIGELLQSRPAPESLRIGITGAPGVGKSTFIEALGTLFVNEGQRVAVLAIDPSSAISKGSILGDKTRMETLAASDRAFIRPSPAGTSLGGVARKTRETIALVEAAGYHTVLVETVGVGQSETAVHSMTDLFLLLLLPGAGDELQGIKRGIVEMADILAVNKAEGDRKALANQARAHYLNATHLLPPKPGGWSPVVLACSALQHEGLQEIRTAIRNFQQHILNNGFYHKNRRQQAGQWFRDALQTGLDELFRQHPAVREHRETLEAAVLNQTLSPFAAAETLLRMFRQPLSDSSEPRH